jgi:predicted enzyme related to lactoylglutathione lyase
MNKSDTNTGPVGSLFEIVIDVEDLDRSARFWSEVLGLKVAGQWGQYLWFEQQDDGLTVVLQRVAEKKTIKNRVHLDIDVEDVDAASSRVEALGGRKLQEVEDSGIRWAVMADPDGNEFCLIHKADIAAAWEAFTAQESSVE